MKKFSLLFLFLLSFIFSFAQEDTTSTVRGLRADGKIYVVGAVVLTILIGLFFFLIRLDRKISRIEKTEGFMKNANDKE